MNDKRPNMPPMHPEQGRRKKLSWREGFQEYVHDPHAKTVLRLVIIKWKLWLFVPLLSEVLVPVLGPLTLADNLVAWPMLLLAFLKMLRMVNYYRNNPPPRRQVIRQY